MVWLSEGSLVVITLAKMGKRVNNQKMHRLPYEHTITWLDDEMIKTSSQTCSTWLIDGVSDKHDTHDWSFIYQDEACVTVNVIMCVSVADDFITNTTRTYKKKALSITRTLSQAWLRHQHWETWMQLKIKAHVKPHRCSRSEPECVWPLSETLQGRLRNWFRPKFSRVVVATTKLPYPITQTPFLYPPVGFGSHQVMETFTLPNISLVIPVWYLSP